MHASTWQRMPRDAARAASAGMSSTTPCAYDGAEPTTRTVEESTASAIAATSARNDASTGTARTGTPK
jgi:hypothetical protein